MKFKYEVRLHTKAGQESEYAGVYEAQNVSSALHKALQEYMADNPGAVVTWAEVCWVRIDETKR